MRNLIQATPIIDTTLCIYGDIPVIGGVATVLKQTPASEDDVVEAILDNPNLPIDNSYGKVLSSNGVFKQNG